MENIDWKNLSFGYVKTSANVRCAWKGGAWGEVEETDSEFINLHMAATCLHYGQEAFEGLKAYRGKDGKIRVFRWEENARRLNQSAREILMPEVPEKLFFEMMEKVIQLNHAYVPPCESGATLYIRPLLIGSSAEVGVKPAKEYLFLMFVTPVGPYFKEGFSPVDIIIDRTSDRAAPLGTGHVKVGGNYAASLRSLEKAHKNNCSSVLFLDAKEKRYIDECGPANFFGIRDNTYVTPDSASILPSITNMSLIELAKDFGMKVERRKIEVGELSSFSEAGACGTAAVITPIRKIIDEENGKVYEFGKDGKPGLISTKLYDRLRAIPYGEEEDKFSWTQVIEV